MKLVVGYLATPGGADAVALGVRLARTLGAELELRLVVEADDVTTPRVTVEKFQDVLADQTRVWLDEALKLVPEDVTAHAEVVVAESVTEALSAEAVRLDALAIVVGGSGGGLIGRYWLGSDVDHLLHFAPVPVAVAPRGTRHSDVARVRTVTCAIGSRPGAKLLLDTAARLSAAAAISTWTSPGPGSRTSVSASSMTSSPPALLKRMAGTRISRSSSGSRGRPRDRRRSRRGSRR